MSTSRAKAATPRPRPRGSLAPHREGRRVHRSWWRLGWVWAIVLVLGGVGAAIGVKASQTNTTRGPVAAATSTQFAPDGTFTTVSGQQLSVSSLRGHPALLWFVSTWCSSCQAGTQAMAGYIDSLKADGVRVVELELYDDLGQSGPSIVDFGHTLAGASYTDPDWTWGTASAQLSYTYDPKSYLDIYYLLDAQGRIVYVNSSPAATMSSLLSHASKLS